jgi:hypothetical protein
VGCGAATPGVGFRGRADCGDFGLD